MARTTGSVVAALTLTAGLALGGASAAQAGSVPADAFLSPADAKAALGELGYRRWKRAHTVPTSLRFDVSCATGLPDAEVDALRANHNQHAVASIRSVIRRFATSEQAQKSRRRATSQVRGCVESLPEGQQMMTGGRVSTDSGTGRVFGATVGSARHAAKVECVVVARDGRAVEVSALHVKTQAVLPKAEIRDLARRELRRLAGN